MVHKIRKQLALLILVACAGLVVDAGAVWAQSEAPAASAPEAQAGNVPGGALGNTSDTEFWRKVRQGAPGLVSIPDDNAAYLIQSEGNDWRAIRNGPLSTYGVWVLMASIILLALFFLLRGRIRIEHGASGQVIERFNIVERCAHWLTAISFVILGLTGLNMLYGRYFLPQILGAEGFAAVTRVGKYLHDFVAYGFMAGLVLIFLLWVRHNIPNRHDLIWMSKAGGLVVKGSHPPSRKFNAGQKIIFWVTILGGLSLSLTGWALLDPFQYHMFGNTFAFLNLFGFGLPTDLTLLQEQQLSHLWHSAIGLIMIAVILGHIYIGSIGMEGAFAAMGSGQVDINWAKEHHNLWVEEVEREVTGRAPAE